MNFMEQILIEAAKQVPSLVVMCVLVWMFIRHIKDSGDAWRATVIEIHKENLEARNLAQATINRNTDAGRENTVAMTKLTGAVEELARKR